MISHLSGLWFLIPGAILYCALIVLFHCILVVGKRSDLLMAEERER